MLRAHICCCWLLCRESRTAPPIRSSLAFATSLCGEQCSIVTSVHINTQMGCFLVFVFVYKVKIMSPSYAGVKTSLKKL